MSKFLNISTDDTLGGNSASDDTVASQKAIKTYVDNHSGGGGSYTAGTGIDITNNVISVDGESVSEVTLAEVATSGDYDDLINKPVSRNIGEIITSTIPLTDAGLHLLDGSLIQGSGLYSAFVTYIAGLVGDYPDLFDTEANWQTSVTNYGSCGKFVYDSVNNTVRLPKRTNEHGNLIKSYSNNASWYRIYEDGWCEQGGILTSTPAQVTLLIPYIDTNYVVKTSLQYSSTSSPGSYNNAFGIYNKTASSFYAYRYTPSISSSITVKIEWSACGYINNSDYLAPIIYEYICLATSTKTEIEVDIDEVMTDLNGKADVDLTNVNNSGTSLGAGWTLPSNTYDDLTLGASGTTYTAPSNGWFTINKLVSSSSQYIRMVNTTNGINIVIFNSNSSGNVRAYIPAKKGDIIEIGYSAGGTLQWFRFVYAKGSESEA